MISVADMEMGGIAGLIAALLAGLVFSFTPVSLAAIPTVAAYITKARAFRETLLLITAFIAGMIVTHVVLGMLAAAGGKWLEQLIGPIWNIITGPFLVLLGLVWIGWLKVPLPWVTLRGRAIGTAGSAFALGIPFTLGICPACSPGLWVGLGASAVVGSVAYGAMLMLLFGIGRSIPILLGAASMGWLESLRPISYWRSRLEAAGGCILIAVGLYLVTDYFQRV